MWKWGNQIDKAPQTNPDSRPRSAPSLKLLSRATSSVGITSLFQRSQQWKQFWRKADNNNLKSPSFNRPWWRSVFEPGSNSSRHSLEDPGSNPRSGQDYDIDPSESEMASCHLSSGPNTGSNSGGRRIIIKKSVFPNHWSINHKCFLKKSIQNPVKNTYNNLWILLTIQAGH